MGTPAEAKAASYAAPTAAAAGTANDPGNGTVRLATSSTAVSSAMDVNTVNGDSNVVPMAGKYCDIQNEDLVNPLEVAFSAAAVTLVYGQTATFAAGSAVAGWRIQPGQTISVIVPTFARVFNHVQPPAVAASTVAVRCSERMVKG